MNWLYLLLCVLVLPSVVSCGYNFTGMAPVQLPGAARQLHLSEVQDPTQEAWLESYLRSNLRDELSRRTDVVWVDENEAQALVRIQVARLRTSDGLTGVDDRQVRADLSIDLEIFMHDAQTGELIWSSGSTRGSSSYYLAQEEVLMPEATVPAHRQAIEEAVDDALRGAVNRLRDDF